jgi:hypothetical protein
VGFTLVIAGYSERSGVVVRSVKQVFAGYVAHCTMIVVIHGL